MHTIITISHFGHKKKELEVLSFDSLFIYEVVSYLRHHLHRFAVPLSLWERLFQSTGFIVGNSRTSRIEAASVRNMTRRSMPMPTPPVGGRPYSMAVM